MISWRPWNSLLHHPRESVADRLESSGLPLWKQGCSSADGHVESEFISRTARAQILLFFTAFRPVVCQLNFLSVKKRQGSCLSGVLSGRDVKMESSQSVDHVKNSWNYVFTPPIRPYGKVYVRTGPTWLLLLSLLYVPSKFFTSVTLFIIRLFSPSVAFFISSEIHLNISYPSVSIKKCVISL